MNPSEHFDSGLFSSNAYPTTMANMADIYKQRPLPPHSSHPNFTHLTLLVFQAVMEVVFLALPGYILAEKGLFDVPAQKFAANINVNLFTPCLIFYKLSSKLRREDLPGLALIPLIFVIQTLVSYGCARFTSWWCGFKKRATNFVVAMAVFGNSNSLPISLVTSLAFTIQGLHWSKEPGDTDSSVASRGLTYLVLFQQLGQILRWSWGYRVLLKPPEMYTDDEVEESERTGARIEGGYIDHDSESSQALIDDYSDDDSLSSRTPVSQASSAPFEDSGSATPLNRKQYAASTSSCSCADSCTDQTHSTTLPTPANGNAPVHRYGSGNRFGENGGSVNTHHHHHHHKSYWPQEEFPDGPKGWWKRITAYSKSAIALAWSKLVAAGALLFAMFSAPFVYLFKSLPVGFQKGLATFGRGVWENLNPPLIAMIAAFPVIVIPQLKHYLYEVDYVKNTFISAIRQGGDVAVPLIIVVLGANLARSTQAQQSKDDPKLENRILKAALIARMLLPMIVMAPILTLTARFLPVNILGDPIFIIVCFLLSGAPSALQLAQICQINDIYLGVITRLLFQSYVVFILPSTIVLVVLALETLEWAQRANAS
ncbi:auxin efflux carrier superfamily [Venturia nashicola]|uniref:Auxin efflux carrier superfamily n=1 Tax=Venturia nashicola TaxID=86259 RepID=A0A4Z1NSK2_9PEZI|nr:auxin efflux carrier superfamily [Venturia nashicola]